MFLTHVCLTQGYLKVFDVSVFCHTVLCLCQNPPWILSLGHDSYKSFTCQALCPPPSYNFCTVYIFQSLKCVTVRDPGPEPSPFPYRGAFVAQAPCGGVFFSGAPSWRPLWAPLPRLLVRGREKAQSVFLHFNSVLRIACFRLGPTQLWISPTSMLTTWPLPHAYQKYDGRSPHCCPFHLLIMLFQEAIKDLISMPTLNGCFSWVLTLMCARPTLFLL